MTSPLPPLPPRLCYCPLQKSPEILRSEIWGYIFITQSLFWDSPLFGSEKIKHPPTGKELHMICSFLTLILFFLLPITDISFILTPWHLVVQTGIYGCSRSRFCMNNNLGVTWTSLLSWLVMFTNIIISLFPLKKVMGTQNQKESWGSQKPPALAAHVMI